MNCCGTVSPNKKEISRDFGKERKMKWGGIKTRVTGDLTATGWKEK
jgi:hypothetical protein